MRSATRNKTGKDPEYLSFIHQLYCVACERGQIWISPRYRVQRIEAHHAGDHGMGQKCPDREAIPLCVAHHTEGPHAIHVLGKKFWEFHRIDKADLIKRLNETYEKLKERNHVESDSERR